MNLALHVLDAVLAWTWANPLVLFVAAAVLLAAWMIAGGGRRSY